MEYLLKKQNGDTLLFFYKDGICIRELQKNSQDVEILFEDATDDFDMITDDNGYIHIVCQDHAGSIVYLAHDNKSWKKFILLQSKNKTICDKHFRMVKVSKYVNLFYLLKYKENIMLVHHIIDNANTSPTIIDYLSEEYQEFDMLSDTENNIIIFYTEKESGRLGYKKFLWSEKKWTGFVECNPAGAKYVAAIKNDKDEIHLAYTVEDSVFYRCFAQTGFNKYEWTKKKLIADCYQSLSLNIESYQNELWITWENGFGVNGVFSKDNGEVFNATTRFRPERGAEVKRFGMRFCFKTEFELSVNKTYGYMERGLPKLFLLQSFLNYQPTVEKTRKLSSTLHANKEMGAAQEHAFQRYKENREMEEFARIEKLKPEEIALQKINIQLNTLQDKMAKMEAKLITLSNEAFERVQEKVESPAFTQGIAEEVNRLKKELSVIKQTLSHKTFEDIFKDM